MLHDTRTHLPLLPWSAEDYRNPPADAATGELVNDALVVTIPAAEAARLVEAIELATPRLLAPFPLALIRLKEIIEHSGMPGLEKVPLQPVEPSTDAVAARLQRYWDARPDVPEAEEPSEEDWFILRYLEERGQQQLDDYAAYLEERAGAAHLERHEWVLAWRQRAVAEARERFAAL